MDSTAASAAAGEPLEPANAHGPPTALSAASEPVNVETEPRPPAVMCTRPPAVADSCTRPRYLTALVEASEPPKHARSFRPSEVVRDLYIGGIRDCKSASALHYGTGARLVVRACPVAKAPAYEVINLPAPNAKHVPSSASEPPAPPAVRCKSLDDMLRTLEGALEAEERRLRFGDSAGDSKRPVADEGGHKEERDADDADVGPEVEPRKSGSAPPKRAVGVITLLQAQDVPSYDMSQHFAPISSALQAVWAKRGLPVVVHCAAGVSRSVSLVVAFLLMHLDGFTDPTRTGAADVIAARGVLLNRVSVVDVLRTIQARRAQAGPNDGFMKQLSEWQKRHQRRNRSSSAASVESDSTPPASGTPVAQ